MNTEKRRISINRYFLVLPLLGGILICAGLAMDGAEAVVCFLFAAFIMIGGSVLLPVCYSFDKQGITFCYLFWKNVRYLWNNIYDISIYGGGRRATYFQLSGDPEGPVRFYTDNRIPKSHRNKRLLEAYWGETITNDLLEDLREWWNERKQKRQRKIAQHMTDEITLMERNTRAQARTTLAPYKAQAAQLGLKLTAKFRYITESGEAQNSRPKSNYTYTLVTELRRLNETDHNHVTVIHTELLRVRLGKTAYRGVWNKNALFQMEQELKTHLGT